MQTVLNKVPVFAEQSLDAAGGWGGSMACRWYRMLS